MTLQPLLQILLRNVAERRRLFRFWLELGACWAVAAGGALVCLLVTWWTGWSIPWALPVVGATAILAALCIRRQRVGAEPDWQALALRIERHYPALEGRLVTAVQQRPPAGGELSYLQERLVREAVRSGQEDGWIRAVPSRGLRWARGVHWMAFVLFGFSVLELRQPPGQGLFGEGSGIGPVVTPGDVEIERGSTLVVLARFKGTLPASVDLVVDRPSAAVRLPLVRSLADPMFGGSLPDVASNLAYHVEYGGRRTRDFSVTVFEHPRLERADADLVFPSYTGQTPRRIENTRHLSAVEGSCLDLTLHLNKIVTSARLVPKDPARDSISLMADTNRPLASLSQFALKEGGTYRLHLIDAQGRTNKVQTEFVFAVLTNRVPELRLASPRGDLRPSPLEEISFSGSVWDDFGVTAFGLAFVEIGKETRFVELGRAVQGKEKRSFQHVLRLEELGLQPDQLLSWFVWADDLGPDGQPRRSAGDLYFAEVRPFEEVFREGQGTDGQSSEAGSGGEAGNGGPSGQLARLQKQIISATWKLQRDQAPKPPPAKIPPQTRNATPGGHRAPEEGGASAYGIADYPGDYNRRPRMVFGQLAPAADPVRRQSAGKSAVPSAPASYPDNARVVRDAQVQALEALRAAQARQSDPRTSALWLAAAAEMERALAQLERATNSPAALAQALEAEQAAYQTLLKLQEHEYQVTRSRTGQRQGNGAGQQMQRQLEEMELTQAEDRYETQRQAQAPPSAQRSEELQVMSRLQELARRQQDLNERFNELQTALQEARTEQERTEVERRLKRLQEQQEQMVADVDELRQQMDRPENQSRLTQERRQLDQTRTDLQRAAEAAAQGASSQALASGTRAQRQLQQIRDQMRSETSSQLTEDLRDLRSQARELSRRQEDLARQVEAEAASDRKSLSDSPQRQATLEQLAHQKERLTNLLERATQISQQAEPAEPLLSRQLHDTVRQFSQDSAKDLRESQEELLRRGLMTRSLYNQLRESTDPDGAKMLDLTAEMLRLGFVPPASEASQRARAELDALKRGVERSAQSVIGDDTQALRLAQQELNRLAEQLGREMARAEAGGTESNSAPARVEGRERGGNAERQAGQAPGRNAEPGAGRRQAARGPGGNEGGDLSGSLGLDIQRLMDQSAAQLPGPLTGDDFVPWSDRLRDVEEMIEDPESRNEVAGARDRARLIRQEYRRERKKPDWAVVRVQVMKPLVEVGNRIAEELTRRESREALVPIDRDPVPSRYSELVRRYYEELGKETGRRMSNGY